MHGEMLMDIDNIQTFSTNLYKYFLPTSLADSCKEELVEFAKNCRNRSGIRQYFTTYNTSLETVDSIGPSCKLLSDNVVRVATTIAEKRVQIDNSFFNYVPKVMYTQSTIMVETTCYVLSLILIILVKLIFMTQDLKFLIGNLIPRKQKKVK